MFSSVTSSLYENAARGWQIVYVSRSGARNVNNAPIPITDSRREDALEALVAGQLALAAGGFLEQALDHDVGGDALGGGGEVGQEAVPQHRLGQGLDVLGLDVGAAVKQ